MVKFLLPKYILHFENLICIIWKSVVAGKGFDFVGQIFTPEGRPFDKVNEV